jgi:hypothetical protein
VLVRRNKASFEQFGSHVGSGCVCLSSPPEGLDVDMTRIFCLALVLVWQRGEINS